MIKVSCNQTSSRLAFLAQVMLWWHYVACHKVTTLTIIRCNVAVQHCGLDVAHPRSLCSPSLWLDCLEAENILGYSWISSKLGMTTTHVNWGLWFHKTPLMLIDSIWHWFYSKGRQLALLSRLAQNAAFGWFVVQDIHTVISSTQNALGKCNWLVINEPFW